jgi:hypothetical protein
MNRLAVQALEKMETRKFNSKSKGRREGSCGALDTLSSSSTSDCAICLEKYIDGEVVAGQDLYWAGGGGQGHSLPCSLVAAKGLQRQASRGQPQGDEQTQHSPEGPAVVQ